MVKQVNLEKVGFLVQQDGEESLVTEEQLVNQAAQEHVESKDLPDKVVSQVHKDRLVLGEREDQLEAQDHQV